MIRKKVLFSVTIAAVALRFCGFVSHASATEVVTYTGTVTSDYEYNFATGDSTVNVFLGDTFTVAFLQNPSRGGYYNNDGATVNSYGGVRWNNASPVEVGTFNVPGLSISVSGVFAGTTFSQNASVNGAASQESSAGYPNIIHNEVDAEAYGPDVPFTTGTGNAAGGFGYVDYYNIIHIYEIQGDVNTVTISSVPEISTWAMMLSGFAALGFAAYRRRKAAPRAG